ncbi:NHL repeat-containing protein [Malonomonas rubra DSM 5091]|uniref:NHL repeat-containing protein n=1 Tax=Malonomonas rubra DSM 5091 TaxID=1122189 RepID=A0A1M6DUX6_MALRU|nr:6-bladed beta-propeller [Malonomonas rubra]SHI77032.1 NHL repeat-containing protein [Malonomonas rubra DSM 5091]
MFFKYARFFLLVILVSMFLGLLGCAKHSVEPKLLVEEKIVWPPAPLEPRIEWVRNIAQLQDETEKGFWGRVKEFFIGPQIAEIVRPYGVATDYGDRLFIADTGASRVHVVGREDGSYSFISGTEDVPLQTPIAMAYVGNDELFITDSSQGTVLRYNLREKTLQPLMPYRLQRPTGIAYSWCTKLLFVTDTAAHQVVAFDRNGVEKLRIGSRGTGEGQFNYPTDIWVDMNGQIYVTDALNARIQMFSVEGGYIGSFGQPGDTPGSFAKPKGVTVDPAGHIYVADALFDAVQIFDAKGKLLMSFGDNGHRSGQFWMPSGIFADRRGYIYVTDTYNRRIQVFRHVNCTMNHDCSR